MKKENFWVILVVILIAVGSLAYSALKKNNGDFKRISYQNRQYDLGDSLPMTIEEVTKFLSGDAIVTTGSFYQGREIFVKQTGPEYANATHTVIFLKSKDGNLYDAYSLVGGP